LKAWFQSVVKRRSRTHDEDHEQFLALDKRQLSHVFTVVEQQIEGPHGDIIIGGSAEMQRVEVEQAEGVEGGHLPVDDAGPCRDSRERTSEATEKRGYGNDLVCGR
jgi:hypothetical protein